MRCAAGTPVPIHTGHGLSLITVISLHWATTRGTSGRFGYTMGSVFALSIKSLWNRDDGGKSEVHSSPYADSRGDGIVVVGEGTGALDSSKTLSNRVKPFTGALNRVRRTGNVFFLFLTLEVVRCYCQSTTHHTLCHPAAGRTMFNCDLITEPGR